MTLKNIKNGDVIYFDLDGRSEVYVYTWNIKVSPYAPYKEWIDSDQMENLGNGIFKYTFNGKSDVYNHLLFKNTKAGNGNKNQTIDLAYITSGIVFTAKPALSNSGHWSI